jgi:uncharacterized protein
MELSRLTLFPVKGLRGIDVPSRRVGPRGLDGDRRWMVVDASGRFLSQRSHPRMVLVDAELAEGGDLLRLHAPEMSPLELPARPEEDELPGGVARLSVTIWNDALELPAPSPDADAWMSAFLGDPVRLVYQPEGARRPVDPAFAPEAEVSLADGYPMLLVSEASLAELNRRLDAPVPMDRFRPNVVVRGAAEPHAEDGWTHFRLGPVPCRGVKPCARCAVTTVHTETGERGKEPLRTLATYRARDGKVWFGQNVVPDGVGTLSVGDPVRVERSVPLAGTFPAPPR